MIVFGKIARRAALLTLVVIAYGITGAAEAASITAPIGSQPGSGAAYAFVGASDGNVWLNTNSGGTWHWQNLVPLNVSFGVGTTAPGGAPAAYAVGTDGNLYIIHQVGSSWSTVNIGTPPGVALRTPVGVISNTSNQPFVFLVGSDGNLWLAHNAGSWTWRNLGTPGGIALTKPVGAVNIPGSYPQIFMIGSDGNLWVSQWNGSSYPWTLLGRPDGQQITAGLWAWESGNLPYGFVVSGNVWYAHQLSSGGAWQWTKLAVTGSDLPVTIPIGMALNDDVAVWVTSGSPYLLSEIPITGCGPPNYACPPAELTSAETVTASVGVADFDEGPFAFMINSSGHLEVAYSYSHTYATVIVQDLGTPP